VIATRLTDVEPDTALCVIETGAMSNSPRQEHRRRLVPWISRTEDIRCLPVGPLYIWLKTRPSAARFPAPFFRNDGFGPTLDGVRGSFMTSRACTVLIFTAVLVSLAGCSSGGSGSSGSTGGGNPNPTPNSVPSISSVTPQSATAGGAGLTITVNGSGFSSNSTVNWNGTDRATTGNGTQLTATITAADIATVGAAQITVVTPAWWRNVEPARLCHQWNWGSRSAWLCLRVKQRGVTGNPGTNRGFQY
jgi:hypothetical protein